MFLNWMLYKYQENYIILSSFSWQIDMISMILAHHFSNIYIIPSVMHALLFQMHNVKQILPTERNFPKIFFQIKKKRR